jgi:hypothetical protein
MTVVYTGKSKAGITKRTRALALACPATDKTCIFKRKSNKKQLNLKNI